MMRIFQVAACAVVGFCAFAQNSAPFAARLDETISAALAKAGAPSVSVAVVEDGRLAYAKAFGKADIAANLPASTATRYAIGSISKQFTAVAILLLEEQGKLTLDDKVAKYFPGLTRAKEITICQLLSHTSGYGDYAPQDYIIPEWQKPTSPQAILDRWAKKPLNFDPGTKWQYSNTGYVLAAQIIEKVAGMPLVDFLRRHVFDPLGMASAGDCSIRTLGDASAYTRFALGPPRPVAREGTGWYDGAAELCMTPTDLAKWDVAFIGKKILSQKSYEEFTKEVKLNDGKPTHYALGLTVGEAFGGPVYSHGGEVSGFLAVNLVYPAKQDAVTVLSNQDGISLTGPLAQRIARIVVEPKRSAEADAEAKDIRAILEGLVQGRIDRGLFTSNANSYFTAAALADYRSSLSKLGKLESVTRVSEQSRGGMKHLSCRAQFACKTVSLNIYKTTDGKIEQFLVVEQF
jgi:D-alanyl-D-alanine carboxypeptidase